MPIVRKLNDLELFCSHLIIRMNGKRDIGVHTLEYEIAKEFGFSKYIQDSVKKALIQFNLLSNVGVGRFKIIYGLKKMDNLDLDEEHAKEEAEKEADKILMNFGG